MAGKLVQLKKMLRSVPSAALAFSGGADSSFLAFVAARTVPGRLMLVTFASSLLSSDEKNAVIEMSSWLGLEHRFLSLGGSLPQALSSNQPNRCYHCKLELFSALRRFAAEQGLAVVLDGTNADDSLEYRPGLRALKELGILSPLLSARIGKKEIRRWSRRFALPGAGRPSAACLATRFPYGEEITETKLQRLERVESWLRGKGFGSFRVRSHQDLARLEFSAREMGRAWKNRAEIEEACRRAGFLYVAMDLRGFRSGSMDEALHARALKQS